MNEQANIKEKAISGFLWSMAENGGNYFLNFLIGLVLIRLIEPYNYGLIGMMTFFIAISTLLVDFGLSVAIVQKKDPTDEDYSTAFWVNIIISIACYAIIFLLSGLVADFYSEQILEIALKIFSLNFVFAAFGVVHMTKITRTLNYKLWARIHLTSVFIAGVTAIVIAWNGYGFWALVAIQLIINFLNTLQLWILGNYNHGFKFSFQSLKSLTRFSNNILYINLINEIYKELYKILIGKFFKTEQLAYYLRAKETSEIFAMQFTNTISKVMFPVLSNFQDDIPNLKAVYKKILIMTGFINFSVLSFLSANGEALFVLLYTEKWLMAVPYFQVLCIEVMLLPIHVISGHYLLAMGKSKTFLQIELSKRIIQTIIILLTFSSIEFLIIGQVITAIIYTGIAMKIIQSQIGINWYHQIKILAPYILLAAGIYVINLLFVKIFFDFGYLINIFSNLLISLFVYISISQIFKFEAFLYTKNVLIEKLSKRIKK